MRQWEDWDSGRRVGVGAFLKHQAYSGLGCVSIRACLATKAYCGLCCIRVRPSHTTEACCTLGCVCRSLRRILPDTLDSQRMQCCCCKTQQNTGCRMKRMHWSTGPGCSFHTLKILLQRRGLLARKGTGRPGTHWHRSLSGNSGTLWLEYCWRRTLPGNSGTLWLKYCRRRTLPGNSSTLWTG